MNKLILENTKINRVLDSKDIVTSSTFKSILKNPFLTLEGAYLTYQITNVVLNRGVKGPEEDISDPKVNDFYFNTQTKEEFKYSGNSWELLDSSILDLVVDTGFSSEWIPITTLKRDNYIELIIPEDTLPINIEESYYIFIGFKNIIEGNKIISSIGIPIIVDDTKHFNRELNNSIFIPIKFEAGFINILADENIKTLEEPELEDGNSYPTLLEILAKYNSYSNDKSIGNLLGTSLIL